MSVPSCFLPPSGALNLSNSSTGSMTNVLVNPYGNDEYDPILAKIEGICTLYNIALQNLIQVAPPPGQAIHVAREKNLSSEVDGYDESLRGLNQNLSSLHGRGIKPRNWGYTKDPIIDKVNLILSECKRLSSNNWYNNSDREIKWHFHGPIEVLTSLKDELISCSADFSQDSTYTQTRTGSKFPDGYETRKLLPKK